MNEIIVSMLNKMKTKLVVVDFKSHHVRVLTIGLTKLTENTSARNDSSLSTSINFVSHLFTIINLFKMYSA